MAAVSTITNGRGYSSRGEHSGEGHPWDFGMPLDTESHASNTQRFGHNRNPSQDFHPHLTSKFSTPEGNDHTNSNGVSQGQSRPAESFDPSYLSPRRGFRPGLSESRSGSEADSLLDLYGHPRSLGDRSVANSMDKERGIPSEEPFLDDEDPERSRWIHRDKLAIIESHELQEAGIGLPTHQTRAASKSKTRTEHTHDMPDLPNQEADAAPGIERKKRRMQSPVRQEVETEKPAVNDFDLRTPEEIAAENHAEASSNAYRNPGLRKSSSRIPLPRSSPMPIPQEHIERGTPLPRKRGASGNWTGEENGISYNSLRSRGNSVGSQVLLDDPDPAHNTPPPASRPASRDSPSKARLPNNPNRSIHSRKTSLTNTTPNPPSKTRQPSTSNASPRTPSSTQRPKSRSGLEPRPGTAVNRPEGEAPWIAHMYKPDPRLPPDQQVIPTHAKRLQQQQQQQTEQAQKDPEQRQQKHDGNVTRDFSPLAEHTFNGLQPSSKDADEKALQSQSQEQQSQSQSSWPLPLPPPTQNSVNNQPAPLPLPEGTQRGGYSTIPRVKQGGNGSPVSPSPAGTQRPLDPFENERVEREKGGGKVEEKKEKEKGCGCCVVM